MQQTDSLRWPCSLLSAMDAASRSGEVSAARRVAPQIQVGLVADSAGRTIGCFAARLGAATLWTLVLLKGRPQVPPRERVIAERGRLAATRLEQVAFTD